MAYNLKYYGEDVNYLGQVVRVDLYKDGYVGSATPRRLVGKLFTLEVEGAEDRYVYTPLVSEMAEAYFWDADKTLGTELEEADDGAFYLVLKIDTVAVWYGVVLQQQVREPINVFPDSISLQAVCGLGLMKDFPFAQADGTLYTGLLSGREIIQACLAKLPFSLSLYVNSNIRPEQAPAGDPLDLVKYETEGFISKDEVPLSCEDVLKQIAIGAVASLKQSQGAWHLQQESELIDTDGYTRYLYPGGGSSVFVPGVDVSITQDDPEVSDNTFRSVVAGLKGVTAGHSYGILPELVPGGTWGSDRTKGINVDADPTGGRRWGRSSGRDTNIRGYQRFRGQTQPRENIDEQGKPTENVWTFENLSNPGDKEIRVGGGPNGNNALRINKVIVPQVFNPEVMTAEDYAAMISTRALQDGVRGINWNENMRLRVRAAVRLVPKDEDDPGGRASLLDSYPVTMKLGVNGYHVDWQGVWFNAPERYIWIQDTTRNRATDPTGTEVKGVKAGPWHNINFLTEPLPAGVEGDLLIALNTAIDMGGNQAIATFQSIEAIEWADIHVDVIIDDIANPAGLVVTVLDLASKNKEVRDDIALLHGEVPIRGAGNSLQLADGTQCTNWSSDSYTPEAAPRIEVVAQEIYTMQRKGVRKYQTSILFEHGMIWPHMVARIEGASYKLGTALYDFGECILSGSFVRVQKHDPAPVVDSYQDQPVGTFISNFDDAAYYALTLYDDLFNSQLQRAVAVTTEWLEPGNITEIEIEALEAFVFKAGQGIVVVNRLNGNVHKLRISQDQAPDDTTLHVGSFEDQTLPYVLDEYIEPFSGIWMNEKDLTSIVSQTARAFQVFISMSEIAELDEDITGEARTDAEITSLIHTIENNDRLFFFDEVLREPVYVRATADHDKLDTTLNFDDPDTSGAAVTLTLKAGTKLYFADKKTWSRFQQLADEILAIVNEQTNSEVIGETSAEIAAGTITAIPSKFLHKALKAGDPIAMMDSTDLPITFKVTADHAATSSPLSIGVVSKPITNPIPIDRPIFIPQSELLAGLRITEDVASLFASRTYDFQESATGIVPVGKLNADVTAGGSITLQAALPFKLLSGAKIVILQFEEGPMGFHGEPMRIPMQPVVTTLEGDHSQGVTTLALNDDVTVEADAGGGDTLIYAATGAIFQLAHTAYSEIAVQADRISAVVSAFDSLAIATMSAAYPASPNRTTIVVTPTAYGSGKVLKKGDTLLIRHLEEDDGTGTTYRVIVDEASETLSGSTTITIQSQSIVTSIGDAVLAGDMTAMRFQIGQIRVESNLFASNNYNGTVNADGTLTPHATAPAGWAFTGQGHGEITGTLFAASGKVRIGRLDGITIRASTNATYDSPLSFDFVRDSDGTFLGGLSGRADNIDIKDSVMTLYSEGKVIIQAGGGNLELSAAYPNTDFILSTFSTSSKIVVNPGGSMRINDAPLAFEELSSDPSTITGYGILFARAAGLYFGHDSDGILPVACTHLSTSTTSTTPSSSLGKNGDLYLKTGAPAGFRLWGKQADAWVALA